jgi:hypothetical protein
MTKRLLALGLAMVAWLPVAGYAADQKPPIPAGSALHIKLGTTLTSKTNKTGDPFTGLVTQPIVVDGVEVIPQGSLVDGHVAFVKPSGRIRGKAQMRIVLDTITTPDEVKYPLSATLQDARSVACNESNTDKEGTIEGCAKSKKKALKQTAIGGAIGAGVGATVGLSTRGGCSYYGCWPSSGPGIGTDIMYGAGIGAGTALIYNVFKHTKHIILIEGTPLTFVINRNVESDKASTPEESSQE